MCRQVRRLLKEKKKGTDVNIFLIVKLKQINLLIEKDKHQREIKIDRKTDKIDLTLQYFSFQVLNGKQYFIDIIPI